MRKIKHVQLNQYVLVTKFSDKNPNDPWYIGLIKEYGVDYKNNYYRVKGSDRYWRNVFEITVEEGNKWIIRYKKNMIY